MLSWKLSVDTIFNCLMDVVEMIAEQQLLPPVYKDYKLMEIIPAVGSVTLPLTGSEL